MVSACLPSDALSQHLLYYLVFSYLVHGVSLHRCSCKVQLLFLTLDEGYLFTTALPDLQCGMVPLGPPLPVQPPLLGRGVALPGHSPRPQTQGSSSQWPSLASDVGWLLSAITPDLGCRVDPPGHCPWPLTQGSSSRPCLVHWPQLPALSELAAATRNICSNILAT